MLPMWLSVVIMVVSIAAIVVFAGIFIADMNSYYDAKRDRKMREAQRRRRR